MGADVSARHLTPTGVTRHTVSAERWDFTFESPETDDMTGAHASVSLVVISNQFGNTQDVLIEAVSERPRPKRSRFSNTDDFLRHIMSIDLSPVSGTAEGTWFTSDLMELLENGEFTTSGIPRWVWRVLMGDTSTKAALRGLVYNLYGAHLDTPLWDDVLPVNGHLRAV